WLDRKGRAELLDGDYKSAIVTLRRAKDLNVAPTILTDLATAYFERGEAEDNPADYQTALDLLDAVLRQNPDDRVALFNRAIIYERMFLFREAAKDWEKYLSFSSGDDWKEEARQHLAEIQKKLRRSYEHDRPLMDFSIFARRVSTESDA